MDEQRFKHLADATFRRILALYDGFDTDDADAETTGATIQITFRGGRRCVINTQTATRQIWLAGSGSGWHFSYDEPTDSWLHDKGTGDELFAVLSRVTREALGTSFD
jgi:iron donor protein CyaY